jgi:hypothetical protein
MNQQPDKLFREKLEGFRKPVSASAWNRVEAQLDKKNNKAIWLRIAAAVILLIAATAIFINVRNGNESETLISRKTIKSQTNGLASVPAEKKSDISIQQKSERPTAKKQTKTKRLNKKQKTQQQQVLLPQNDVKEMNTIAVEEEIMEEIMLPSIEVVDEKIAEQIPVDVAQQNTEVADSGLKIVYSSEEVDEKYLDKKSLTQATSEVKKTSTLRKLLEKAYNLKHNQDPLGELRQKKNEILALDFKKDKQRSQNR